jgi:hypothetical protein
MATRYVADWIVKQHFDEIGEWLPDRDEHGERVYKSLAAAKKGGCIAARKAGVFPWVRVREQHARDHDDHYGAFVTWESVWAWVSDYDGTDWGDYNYEA